MFSCDKYLLLLRLFSRLAKFDQNYAFKRKITTNCFDIEKSEKIEVYTYKPLKLNKQQKCKGMHNKNHTRNLACILFWDKCNYTEK